MATVTPEEADRIMRKLAENLNDPSRLRADYAEAVMRGAVRIAGARPSPQARMAAQALTVKGGTVLAPPRTRVHTRGRSVPAGDITFGAEYGSSRHRQFAPRRTSGYFLNPAAEEVDARPGDEWADDVIDASLRLREVD